MRENFIETKSAGLIKPKKGPNPRLPYDHQRDAINAMDNLNKNYSAYRLTVR